MNMGLYTRWQLNMTMGDQRNGQALFNAAHATYGSVVDEVRGSPHDPFHDDNAIPLFLAWLETRVS